jgi:hypothetical protein
MIDNTLKAGVSQATMDRLWKEFLNHCYACGGNWTRMLMTGIQNRYPERWEALEDKTWEFIELAQVVADWLQDDYLFDKEKAELDTIFKNRYLPA